MSRRDGADEDEPTLRARMNRSRMMRELLAEHAGIEPVNRGNVRRILIAAGVPEHRLRWMTVSCISEERALELYPPLIEHPQETE